MNENNLLVRFDWAAKRILRDKANFGVLEGLLTVLLKEKITISQILESESNQNFRDEKFNRVDIKAINISAGSRRLNSAPSERARLFSFFFICIFLIFSFV